MPGMMRQKSRKGTMRAWQPKETSALRLACLQGIGFIVLREAGTGAAARHQFRPNTAT